MEKDVYQRMARLEDRHWWFQARRTILGDVIARIIRPGEDAKILEAGCGTGGNLAMLGHFGSVSALEPDDDARQLAVRKSDATITDGALPGPIPFEKDKFDLIVALDVLEHVEDDEGSLRQLLARLRPGGSILITVPALPMLWSRHDVKHHHKRRYTRQTLREMIGRAGGDADKLSYFNTLLFPLIAGVKLVHKLFGMERGNDDTMPSAWLNRSLRTVFASERHLLAKTGFPIGVSLLAVVRPACACDGAS